MSRPLQTSRGEGDTPSPIKPREVEGGEEKRQRERQRFKERGTVEKMKVGGKLMPDKPEWMYLNEMSPPHRSTIKPP